MSEPSGSAKLVAGTAVIGLGEKPQKDSVPRGVDVGIVALTLLAPALGGPATLWAQAVVVGGGAVLIFLDPPRRGLPRGLAFIAGGLLVLAALNFLPAVWFPTFPWRAALVNDHGLRLPATLSPQPWVSCEGALTLLAGLVWTAFLLTRQWTVPRRQVLSLYCAGLLLLELTAFTLYFGDWSCPLWEPLNGPFGFFPNRNHTANVLALGGIVLLALTFHDFAKERHLGFLWLTGYALTGTALVVNYSRAGIVLFFGGSLAWLVWVAWRTRRARQLSLGLAGLLLLAGLFFLSGGRTRDRFLPHPASGTNATTDFRVRVQTDALSLLQTVSWRGAGLGNFEPVFAGFRHASKSEQRALHPESDWLWVGIEMGWLAPALLLAGLVYWLGKNWPVPAAESFYLRTALAISGILFALHSLVDVAGHRLGALWPVLLLLSLLKTKSPDAPPARGIGTAFRGAAGLLAGVSLWWLASGAGLKTWPTSATVAALKTECREARARRDGARAARRATEALRGAPLDWELYYERALAEVRFLPSVAEPLADFARARHLEPNAVALPMAEAAVWLAREPRLACAAWHEALHRATERRGELFEQIIAAGQGFPQVAAELFSLADSDRELLAVFLAHAPPAEFRQELDTLRTGDPDLQSLTAAQQTIVFDLWGRLGDPVALADQFRRHPAWLPNGWRALAELEAARGNFHAACDLARRFAAPPVLPALANESSVPELKRQLLVITNDYASGFALYRAQLDAHEPVPALETLRKLTAQPAAPRYFAFLQAGLEAQQENWEAAWLAWRQFLKD